MRPLQGRRGRLVLTTGIVDAGVVVGGVAATGVRGNGRLAEGSIAVPAVGPFPASVAYAGLGVAFVA